MQLLELESTKNSSNASPGNEYSRPRSATRPLSTIAIQTDQLPDIDLRHVKSMSDVLEQPKKTLDLPPDVVSLPTLSKSQSAVSFLEMSGKNIPKTEILSSIKVKLGICF